uniref:CRAL-TRIO domain-containing protein n=1 Tax=Seriola dumerili TaxID=41447 RepID=A0A3B4T7R9_SERDU
GSRPRKKKVLVAPALSLSLGNKRLGPLTSWIRFSGCCPTEVRQHCRWRSYLCGALPGLILIWPLPHVKHLLYPLCHLSGYYGDGLNDIIVFSSCYLPQNSLENYQYVMDNLFRYVVGTLDLMVAENYVIVYLCAGGQKDKLPGISWLRECYTTIHRRLRKNLKGFYVVHPTWYIKALITIIKPFISSKFSRKLQFADSLEDLSHFIPTEHVQIPDCLDPVFPLPSRPDDNCGLSFP